MARSRKSQSQQTTLSLFDEADLVTAQAMPPSVPFGLRDFPAQTTETIREVPDFPLMRQVVDRQNMRSALKRVKENNGAAGIDNLSVSDLTEYLMEHWSDICQSLLNGSYRPQPVKRVEIPKPTGGVRLLGIPTVVDRLIQQAILQVLTPLFDPHFSKSSFGFRPRRRGHSAVRQAREYAREGYSWVVDIDLEKFFDRVNHDMLMARVARRVSDKMLLRLIRRFLESDVLINGVVVLSEEGTPQGGPLSPLFSNIMLDDLDKELESREHKFVRYADDCNIYVRSRRAGERVKASLTAFLKERLHLQVNEGKSAVDRPWNRKFLGFTFERRKLRIVLAEQSSVRVKDKIRSITRRSTPLSLSERIKRLNEYLGGWLGYFSLAETPSFFRDLDSWLRRRLRACLWTQWKQPRTRARKLRHLGLKEHQVWAVAGSQRGAWRLAKSHSLHLAMNNAYWQAQGLIPTMDRYSTIRNGW
jgi:RNA-directed DNA polymerase